MLLRQRTAKQEADALARRKELYEAPHPQARAGQSQAAGMHRKRGRDVGAGSAPTYVDSTAEILGVSTRTVQSSVQVANNLSEGAVRP